MFIDPLVIMAQDRKNQMSINRKMDEQIAAHLYNRVQLSNTKEQITETSWMNLTILF